MASKSAQTKGKTPPPAKRKGKGNQRQLLVIGIAAAVAIVVAIVLIVLSQRSDTSTGASADQIAAGDVAELPGGAEIAKLLDGIPQDGMVLGDPNAPVTLVEYGDLRCPSCRSWDNEVAPQVIEQLVRPGKAKLEFRIWPITGDAERSTTDAFNAGRAGLAAAEQDRFWHFALLFYKNQPDETTTYVTDAFARGLAKAAGVPDLAKFDADRADPTRELDLQQNDVDAKSRGFSGTPSFLVVGPGGEAPLQGDERDIANITAELEKAAAAG